MSDEEQGFFFDMDPGWTDQWQGMPGYEHDDLQAWRSIIVNFRNREDWRAFEKLVGQRLPVQVKSATRSIWYPEAEIGRYADKRYASRIPKFPRWPVYIPSKGRADSRATVKAFERIGMPYRVVVEPQEYDTYAAVIDPEKILTLPHQNKGLVVTRNWIWDHAAESGTERFWTFDDNIMGFFRFNNNLKVPVSDPTIFRVIEDFVERYENVPIAGCNYFMFVTRKAGNLPPFVLNTRVYSNMLISTDARDRNGKPYRNEGFYNDDTDLCLRVLKDGWCTVLFNAFLALKSTTMTKAGGMTPHYQDDGRYKMAKELADKHPDVVRVTERWGRSQHYVDYKIFRRNKLKLKPGVTIPEGQNDYGMELRTLSDDEKADEERFADEAESFEAEGERSD